MPAIQILDVGHTAGICVLLKLSYVVPSCIIRESWEKARSWLEYVGIAVEYRLGM